MDDLISRRALYDKAATLEAQALDYVGKLIERDGEETSVEWRIWSAILIERTAFKHDVYDAPSVEPKRKRGKWIIDRHGNWACDQCGNDPYHCNMENMNFCPNCGADMREEKEAER